MSNLSRNSIPVAVIGAGNPLLSDEGVGVHVVRVLSDRGVCPDGVEIVDAGPAGMKLLHLIAHRRKVVLVDCARMNAIPGTLRRFTPSGVKTIKALAGFSAHEGDLLKVIDLSSELGEAPEQTVIFGIEPESVQPGDRLSTVLQANLDHYVHEIVREVTEQVVRHA